MNTTTALLDPDEDPMKPSVNERLDQILGLEAIPEETTTEIVPHQPAEIAPSGNPEKDMQDDYNVARTTLRNLVEKGSELVDNANYFAREKQDAKTVEAASMALKEARENALALLNLHKTRKDIERISTVSPAGDTNVTNNVAFIGTTGDLLKMTKELNADGMLNKVLKTIDVEPQEPDTPQLNSGENPEKK